MQEAQHEVSHVINIKIHHHIVAMIMKVVGDVLMGTLLGEETPAYNLYGLFRFNTDLMYLQTYANESPIPHMEARTTPPQSASSLYSRYQYSKAIAWLCTWMTCIGIVPQVFGDFCKLCAR